MVRSALKEGGLKKRSSTYSMQVALRFALAVAKRISGRIQDAKARQSKPARLCMARLMSLSGEICPLAGPLL